MNKTKTYDFTYECHKCKTLIPGHFDAIHADVIHADVIFMVKSSVPNTWLFECEHCYKLKP